LMVDALVEGADHQLSPAPGPSSSAPGTESRALITGTCRLHVPA
jgi:hypothetical protein